MNAEKEKYVTIGVELARGIGEGWIRGETLIKSVAEMERGMSDEGIKYLIDAAMNQGFENKGIERRVWKLVGENGTETDYDHIQFWIDLANDPSCSKLLDECNGNLSLAREAKDNIQSRLNIDYESRK